MKTEALCLAPPLDERFYKSSLAAKAPPNAKTLRFYLYTMHYWQSETILDEAFLAEIPENVASRLAPLLLRGSLGVEGARPLFREMSLVRGGRPVAVIVSPGEEEYLALARRLSRSIHRATGANLPIVKKRQALEV